VIISFFIEYNSEQALKGTHFFLLRHPEMPSSPVTPKCLSEGSPPYIEEVNRPSSNSTRKEF